MAHQLEKVIKELSHNSRELEDFIVQWTDTRIDACLAAGEGQAACAPLELLGGFRTRTLDRLQGTMRKLKAKGLQLQDAVVVPVTAPEEKPRKRSHTSVTHKTQNPKKENFRSSAMGHEVELCRALGDGDSTPADKLTCCVDTLNQLGHQSGSHSQIVRTIGDELKKLLFEGSVAQGLNEYSGCILDRFDALSDKFEGKEAQLVTMQQQLEAVCHPAGRLLTEEQMPSEFYNRIVKDKEDKLSSLSTAAGRETFMMEKEEGEREGEAEIGKQLPALSENFAAFGRLCAGEEPSTPRFFHMVDTNGHGISVDGISIVLISVPQRSIEAAFKLIDTSDSQSTCRGSSSRKRRRTCGRV